MGTLKDIKVYLSERYKPQEIPNVLLENNLNSVLLDGNYEIDSELKNMIFLNEIWRKKQCSTIYEICNLLYQKNIKYILFKGIMLSQLLYGNVYSRVSGDVDIFVTKEDFDRAYNLIIKSGFLLVNEKYLDNGHIVALAKDNVLIELHKNILNPRLSIDESFLQNNIQTIQLNQSIISTFNTTATLLHLIYHLYAHTFASQHKLNSVLINTNVSTTKRFLYRAYEIALFSEKYQNKIKWDDIIEHTKHQKFRVFFKKMIYDIVNIFPDAFPDRYLQVVNSMEYIDDEHDIWCKRLLSPEYNQQDMAEILCGFINEYWAKRSAKNIHIKAGDGFVLDKPRVKGNADHQEYNLSCDVSTEKVDEALKITFVVSQDDLCFTEIGNYDTNTSDGIHLILSGTEKYSFNSIYVFPKIINGKVKAIPVDIKNGKRKAIDISLVSTDCKYTGSGYTVTVTLTKQFLQNNGLTNYLYMGLVIVDCSSEKKKRKAELVLSDTYSEWCNPIYFAKIDFGE